MISNCVIERNVATALGGGLFCGYVEATISNSTIAENSAPEGGGLSSVGSSVTLTNCTLAANAASVGGATYNSDGSATLANCILVANSADDGGAMYNYRDSIATVANCTFTANLAANGAAVACGYDGPSGNNVDIANCVLWNGGGEIWDNGSSSIDVTYSDVQGGWPGEGNIDADPLFVGGFLGDYYLSQTAAGQPVDSPCVNTGSDTAENLGLDTRTTRTDQVGDAGIVDMGFHYPMACVGDLDGDNDTDQADLGILLADWGCDDPVNGCAGDLNGDDRTDQADLGILLADWGCTN